MLPQFARQRLHVQARFYLELSSSSPSSIHLRRQQQHTLMGWGGGRGEERQPFFSFSLKLLSWLEKSR
jgi:hypothetical protein